MRSCMVVKNHNEYSAGTLFVSCSFGCPHRRLTNRSGHLAPKRPVKSDVSLSGFDIDSSPMDGANVADED